MRLPTQRAVEFIAGAILGLIAMGVYLQWIYNRDQKLEEASLRYEQCVEERYHTNPVAYYNQHGELPECDITQ